MVKYIKAKNILIFYVPIVVQFLSRKPTVALINNTHNFTIFQFQSAHPHSEPDEPIPDIAPRPADRGELPTATKIKLTHTLIEV